MDDITLYTNPFSRGRTVRWMLEEIGSPYNTVLVEHGPKMKAAEYLAINPMGKVPALRHGDRIVTETAAIITYLGHIFPNAGLVPDDRSAFYRWMFFCAGPVDYAFSNQTNGWIVTEEKRGHSGYGTFDDIVRVLSNHLKESPYFCGDNFTAVDVLFGAKIGMGLERGLLPSDATFTAYWDRVKDRPARLRANALDDALLSKP